MQSAPVSTSAPAVPVALLRCASYEPPVVRDAVFRVLDASGLAVSPGARVLVKPNLLMAKPLACTHPQVVAAACEWLLGRGARVAVADSPGFGRASAVAEAIGLTAALRPLGLAVAPRDRAACVELRLPDGGRLPFRVSRRALEADLVLSAAKVKAHSQMELTLAVKNCFGCVPGLGKALVHAREGQEPELFADAIAALWAALTPVAALADGVTAMHVTGPSRGEPFALGLVGASVSAPALDTALRELLGAPVPPLERALGRRAAAGDAAARPEAAYPLLSPGECRVQGFIVPAVLKHTSFSPGRLVKSLCRRAWAAVRG
ncbi:MAG: DUF362 domain-containing protein [Desulfovibrio sp.]|uniref:DUF362 domain-containing protein n=1 Tax=Desulfovibrio sp. TaxID=885 RepID=UPI001A6E4627|nr:DUF362 domain-containing protein [Desulfovibrio sp.]MBD5417033.1 DUF362 domain-containing protein [Desulfovibrio sp.]